jgi:hypothetical protein
MTGNFNEMQKKRGKKNVEGPVNFIMVYVKPSKNKKKMSLCLTN